MISYEIFDKIANYFGTPIYVYEEEIIQRQLRNLLSSIVYGPLGVLYAMKANSNPHILGILQKTGKEMGDRAIGIDAVSPGEIALALKTEFPAKDILFTGNNITDEEMDFAVEKGVLLNIDSLSRLDKFGKIYPGQRICVRINPDVGAGHHDHCITGGPESKFGIWFSEVEPIKRIAQKYHLRIVGIHQHIGSQILKIATFLDAMDQILETALNFPDLEFVDLGGGFGVPYSPEEEPLDIKTLGQGMYGRFIIFCNQYKRRLKLIVEPGRYLVAQAGYLLVRVNTIKRNPDGKIFVGVDSGFNHLIRPAMYDSYHQIENISNPDGEKEKVDVVGNICESGDRFAKQRPINQPREGDLLMIKTAGAYGYSMSSNYNLRPKPAEVLIKNDGKLELIRKREKIDHLINIS